ncbi:hypothetical protein HDU93_005383 [Gonapodya sp. JEL0774]|nr:hypothetical protein HDU93_005383 [Gonapodya sp. JEL0774]
MHLSGVVRIVKRCAKHRERVVGSLEKIVGDPRQAGKNSKTWANLPSRESIQDLISSVTDLRSLFVELIRLLPPTYTLYRRLLAATYFMPSSLVVCAAVARCWVVAKEYVEDLRGVEDAVTEWWKRVVGEIGEVPLEYRGGGGSVVVGSVVVGEREVDEQADGDR